MCQGQVLTSSQHAPKSPFLSVFHVCVHVVLLRGVVNHVVDALEWVFRTGLHVQSPLPQPLRLVMPSKSIDNLS